MFCDGRAIGGNGTLKMVERPSLTRETAGAVEYWQIYGSGGGLREKRREWGLHCWCRCPGFLARSARETRRNSHKMRWELVVEEERLGTG